MLKATVCELPAGWTQTDAVWEALKDHVQQQKSDLLLLPEMPFSRWLAASPNPDLDQWAAAVAAHDRWLARMYEMPASMVIGTRPVISGSRRYNQGFAWTKSAGLQLLHTKCYLPDEPGFWEASWYAPGKQDFGIFEIGEIRIGFLICTELWFGVHARDYAKQGIHLLVCPRATPAASIDRWLAGGRTAAIVSGAYCLSSNFSGPNVKGIDFGGTGWIMEPEGGRVLGTTTPAFPFFSLEIDPVEAEKAKKTYPRYVKD